MVAVSLTTAARSRRIALARAAGVVAAVIAVDQLTKHTIGTSIAPGHARTLVPGVLTLVYVPIAAALTALVGLLALRPARRWLWLPTGMLVGGALSNLIDRVASGSVIDFIKLPDWPAFNFADISITVGAVVLALVVEFGGRRRDRDG